MHTAFISTPDSPITLGCLLSLGLIAHWLEQSLALGSDYTAVIAGTFGWSAMIVVCCLLFRYIDLVQMVAAV